MSILLMTMIFAVMVLTFDISQAFDEFPIATTAGREMSASTAFDGTNYLVGIQGDADFHTNVTAQLVSPSGTLVGSLIKTGGTGGAPFVAFDGTNYLMVWEEDAPRSTHIYGQFVTKAGAIVGSQIIVGTGSDMRLSLNSILFDGINYFVVWENRVDPYGGDNADVYGQFVTPSGTLLGGPIPVSTAVHGQRMPTMAFDGANILVIWADGRNQGACYTDPHGTHCFESDIYGQFITKSGSSSAGILLGSNFAINKSALPRDNPPYVAFGRTNYLITFAEETTLPNACPPGGCKWDIYGQLVTKAGAPIGSKITISNTSPDHTWPGVLFDGTNYLAGWTEGFGSTRATVKGRFFDQSGSPLGSEFTVFSPSGDRVALFGPTLFDGSRYFSVVNRGTPGSDPNDLNTYTNMDVFGAFFNPLAPIEYTLTVTKAGNGNGTITSNPAGINCGSDCSETYTKVQKVKLTARADGDSTFTGWSVGGCSGTRTCTVTVDDTITVTATFALKIPDISVAGTSLDFGSIKVGKKATRTLNIKNNGSGDLNITLSVLGGFDFSIPGSSSVTIKAKKSYNIKVLFAPKSTGSKTGTLRIASNDPDTPVLDVSLSGTGSPTDTTPPSVPKNLSATAVSSSQINLSWDPSTDKVGVTGYKVYRGGAYLKSVTTTSTSDTGLNANTPYCYSVSAYDAAGNESGQCSQACATTLVCPTPGVPSSPSPSDGATGVSANPTLNWSATSNTDSYDVYFGTSTSPPLVGNVTSASYPLSGLSPGTLYYWKVVAKSSCGNSTSGPVWSFTTCPMPGMPSAPSPLDGATGVSTSPMLSWAATSNTDSYDVYFGTSTTPPLAGNVTSGSYPLSGLSPGTVYHWKLVAKNSCGNFTSGIVWSFTTLCPTPGTPSGPSPSDGATGVSTSPTLNWAATSNTDSYDVYFGTSTTPPFVGNTISTSYPQTGLSYNTTYYWKIVGRNSCGNSTSGVLWSFLSEAEPIWDNLTPEQLISNVIKYLRAGNKAEAMNGFTWSSISEEVIGNLDAASLNNLADFFEGAQLMKEGDNYQVYQSNIEINGETHLVKFILSKSPGGEWRISNW